ncbi:ABC transporter ATP-binding protein [Desulfohalovibrio reitneri]|uniref:ABC transporter ATP-binding protein n=1 Tax=Desulfohalovibrio reitneri TaxID=1307759 RepID=UPI0004A6BA0B|nr:ATP-binding cassette domain-containing protein [Desulfohalovibrio reitneri]
MTRLLELDGLGFAHPGRPPLFSGLDLVLERGDFTLIKGPSGSGKSTFLRLLCRLEDPAEGTIRFQGAPIQGMEPARLRREMAFIQQTPTVVEGSVRDNLLLPFSFAANSRAERPSDRVLNEWLARFRLEGVGLGDRAATLSVGQKQRVCIIRALLLGPAAVLMDEPTSALDPESTAIVHDEAEWLARERGVTVLLASHGDYLPSLETHRVLHIEGGRAEVS